MLHGLGYRVFKVEGCRVSGFRGLGLKVLGLQGADEENFLGQSPLI